MSNTCSRCGDELETPTENNANYLTGTEFGGKEPREVFYAMYHTEETKARLNSLDALLTERDRQAISAEIAHPGAVPTVEVDKGKIWVEQEGSEVETRATEEVEFSAPTHKFDHFRVESPEAIKDDDDAAFAYSVNELIEVEKTGLVCSACTSEDDDVIWGIDG